MSDGYKCNKSFKSCRNDEIHILEEDYKTARDDYISKYTDFYNNENGVTEEDVKNSNNILNDKLKALQRNNDQMNRKVQKPEVDAEEWLDNWNRFKENRGSATTELHKIQKRSQI